MKSVFTKVLAALMLLALAGSSMALAGTGNPDFDRAFSLHCDGQCAAAIEAYGVVVSANQDRVLVARAQFAIGACYFTLKDYENAVTAFLGYAASHPEDRVQAPLALVYAANCRMDQKRFEDARVLYQRVLDQGLDRGQGYAAWADLGMGRYLVNMSQCKEALPYLENAIKEAQEPKVIVEAKLYVSECGERSGASAEAVKPLDDILTMDTSGPYPASERAGWEALAAGSKGAIMLGHGEESEVLDFMGKVLLWRFDQPVARVAQRLIGLALIGQGRMADAKQHYGTLAAANPSDGEWKSCLAYCTYREGKWAEARDAFQNAINSCAVGAWCAEAKYFLGDCCARLGDSASAKSYFGDVVSGFPNDDWADVATVRLSALRGK